MTAREIALSNVGGNWGKPHCAYLTWPDFDRALLTAELIAEDHSYTFRTTEQRHARLPDGRVYDPTPHLPYGPQVPPCA